MPRADSIASLDSVQSAEVLDVFNDFKIHGSSFPKPPTSIRPRTMSKLQTPVRRDSQTLPVRSTALRATRSASAMGTEHKAATHPPKRSDSPDIETIIAKTPRPRRTSSQFFSTPPRMQSRSSLRTSPKSDSSSVVDDTSFNSDFGTLLEDDSEPEDGDGSETDSSIDVHTPLPQVMFRDGLLSPRSKLLSQSSPHPNEFEGQRGGRSQSVLSLASTAGSVSTKFGLQKDPRDTHRRRLRHRDGHLLKQGMGLTTGLGWSDSEDEDAPSLLTRRLITSTIERKQSTVSSPSRMSSPTMSRFGSPTPSAKSVLSRRAISSTNMRSASVSIPARQPSVSASTPGAGLRVPRGRASSTASSSGMGSLASASSLLLSHTKSSLSVSNAGSSLRMPPTKEEDIQEIIPPTTPTSANPSPVVPRARTDSLASSATTRSAVSSVSASTQITTSTQSKATSVSRGSGEMPHARGRTDSSTSASASASTTSLASTYSQYSQASTSTASSASVVPRPLRLPQTAALAKRSSRSFSQDITFSSPVAHTKEVFPTQSPYQRARTLSNPHAPSQPHPHPQPPPTAPLQHSFPTTTFNPATGMRAGVLPPGAPPTLRQRQSPAGARPRPRTGTGMVYRTSSYSYASLHDAAAKMGGISEASVPDVVSPL